MSRITSAVEPEDLYENEEEYFEDEPEDDWEEETPDDDYEDYEADQEEAYVRSIEADEERFLNNLYR